jgi:hypothetical protein
MTVSVGPGAYAFTLILCGPNSRAKTSVSLVADEYELVGRTHQLIESTHEPQTLLMSKLSPSTNLELFVIGSWICRKKRTPMSSNGRSPDNATPSSLLDHFESRIFIAEEDASRIDAVHPFPVFSGSLQFVSKSIRPWKVLGRDCKFLLSTNGIKEATPAFATI